MEADVWTCAPKLKMMWIQNPFQRIMPHVNTVRWMQHELLSFWRSTAGGLHFDFGLLWILTLPADISKPAVSWFILFVCFWFWSCSDFTKEDLTSEKNLNVWLGFCVLSSEYMLLQWFCFLTFNALYSTFPSSHVGFLCRDASERMLNNPINHETLKNKMVRE